MAPKELEVSNPKAIISLRKKIAAMANEEGAESIFEAIDEASLIIADDKKRLQFELQTRVNEIQQGEIDKKVAAKDQKGADKIINSTEEEQLDEKGQKLPSARKPLRSAEEILEDNAESESKLHHVPSGCKAVEMTVEKAQEYELNDMTLPSKDRKLMGMKPITDGRRDTPITKFLVIVKIALFLAFVLFSGKQAMAAVASDDVAVLTDFTQTKGLKVNASGNVVPVTDSAYTLGGTGTEWSAVYADAVYVGGGATSIALPTTLTTNAVDIVNSVWGSSNAINLEGATANAFELTLAPFDVTADRTATFPDQTGTVQLSGAATALTAGAAVTLTVATGVRLYTDTITTDNQDQTITFSGSGAAGDEVTIIFVTDAAGAADEVITFHSTLCRSTGTLTLANAASSRYVVRFMSDGSKWNEISRTAIQAA